MVVKGWPTAKLGCSWPSVSTWGSGMVAFRLETQFDTDWPREDDFRPRFFFPNGSVEPKALISEEWRCWVNNIRDSNSKPVSHLSCKLIQIHPRQTASCLFIFYCFWDFQTEQYRYHLVLKMELLTRKHQGCEFQTCFPFYLIFLFSW